MLEDRIAASNAPPSSYDIADLAGLWRTRMQSIEAFLTGLDTKRLDVEPLDHAQLIDSLVRRQDYDEILTMVTLWSWPRMAERLARHRVTEQREDQIIIEVKDDGPGIDQDALFHRACARYPELALGAPPSMQELVLMAGLSSREQVSELSGRGIGLAAVKLACEAEGGSIEVLSLRGRGTTFRFTFRRPVLSQHGLAETLERRWSLRPQAAANANAQPAVRTTG